VPVDDQPTAVETVVVTGRANDIRTSVDSISYSVAEDLQSPTGTLADALRNIPSVEVDPDGNVTLRGDPGVTILVDGRPSALLSGQSQGQAVLTLPAAQYARIEVMTNPSAAYRPDGSGGVINLITKPTPVRPGVTRTGSVRAAVGDAGRYNLGLNAAWSRDRLTLTADAGLRHDAFAQRIDHLRERFDAGSGQFLEARQSQDVDGVSDSAFVRLSADYRLDDRTQLVGEFRFTDIDSDSDTLDLYEADDASGGVASAYRRQTSGGYSGEFAGVTARLVRRFDDQGHEWSTDLRLDRVRAGFADDAFADQFVPAAAPLYETVELINDVDQLGLTSAYVRPLADGGKLRAGYELQLVDLVLDNRVLRGPAPSSLVVDPTVSNDYHVDQAVHALYATWERPFGDRLTAQFGLRLEQVDRALDQATSGVQISNGYFRGYPTLHASYALTDTQTLRASYSQRVQRPAPSQLNPFLTYDDPFNLHSGNPDLEPQDTDSYELSWQRRVDQTFYQATLYYRDTTGAFTPVTTDLGGGVFLTRPENLGALTTTGLELVANGRLHPTLRYNASLNAFRQEIDASDIPGGVDRSGDVVSGRLSLNWQPTRSDFVQLSGVWTGEQLVAQGRREGATLINLGYRRKLTDAVALNLTVRDLLDQSSDLSILDTPLFRDRTERTLEGRIAFVGLTWTFGGQSRQQEPAFDFSAPQTGG
jgi:outer membrane receptor protein involved in Fe transport